MVRPCGSRRRGKGASIDDKCGTQPPAIRRPERQRVQVQGCRNGEVCGGALGWCTHGDSEGDEGHAVAPSIAREEYSQRDDKRSPKLVNVLNNGRHGAVQEWAKFALSNVSTDPSNEMHKERRRRVTGVGSADRWQGMCPGSERKTSDGSLFASVSEVSDHRPAHYGQCCDWVATTSRVPSVPARWFGCLDRLLRAIPFWRHRLWGEYQLQSPVGRGRPEGMFPHLTQKRVWRPPCLLPVSFA